MLMDVMSNQKKQELEAQTRVENRRSVTAQLASYTSQNRQQLSCVFVQAQKRLVLDRLASLGGGGGQTGWSTSGPRRDRLRRLQQGKAGGSGEQEISKFDLIYI